MRKFETWLTGLSLAAVALLLLPMAVREPLSLAAAACADGSAHLVMGCASILL